MNCWICEPAAQASLPALASRKERILSLNRGAAEVDAAA
jgi:hypothetical protein